MTSPYRAWTIFVSKDPTTGELWASLTTSDATNSDDLLSLGPWSDASVLSREALSLLDSSLSWFLREVEAV